MFRSSRVSSSRRAAARPITAIATALLILGAAAGAAYAGHQDSGVKSYTGCLATQGGTLTLIREGDAPAKPCPNGALVAHFSGGDITSVTAGTGLQGGGPNGAVTLSLDPQYALRQDCADGDVVKWNATDGQWQCEADNNATYGAGTGLDLSGSTFSVEKGFRLPQGCDDGDLATFDGTDTWECSATPDGAPLSYFGASAIIRLVDDDQGHEVVRVRVPAGKYFVEATGWVQGADGDDESDGSCSLVAPPGPAPAADVTYHTRHTTPNAEAAIALSAVITATEDASVAVMCTANSSFDQADTKFQLTAIAVR
jgi:hypothetical protein